MHATPEQFVGAPGGNERRARPRHAPKSIAYVKVDDANGGVIVDLSESGIAIASVDPLQEDASPRIQFELPRIDRRFEVSAEIVWESDSRTKAGLRFVSLSVDERVQIRNWIKDELFAEALPTRAAKTLVMKRLPFSYETLNTTEPAANPNPLPREERPRVPAKVLPDILAPAPFTLPQEFERLFPSEKTPGAQPIRSSGNLEAAPAEEKIETTAYWLNFPSEADLPPRKSETSEVEAIAESPKRHEETETGADLQQQEALAVVAEPIAESRSLEADAFAPEAGVAGPELVDERGFSSLDETFSPLSASDETQRTSQEVARADEVTSLILLDSHSIEILTEERSTEVSPAPSDGELTPSVVAGRVVPESSVSTSTSIAPADEPSEVPVHELNPAPQGPEFVASHLELVDIAQAVREPGIFSGGAVSDASIESLLAIAEAEESSAQNRNNLSVVRDLKPAVAKSPISAIPGSEARYTAAALPHVALRSPSQQVVPPQDLADGDKRYRGLLIAACFIFLALCFAVGYSRHIQLPWTSPRTQNDSSPVANAAAPDSPPVSGAPAPSGIAPSGAADASAVAPDSKFTAPPIPSTPAPPPPSFFPVTAPAEGSGPRMVELPEAVVFDSPKVLIRLRQYFFIQPQPGPEWSHNLERIQVGEPLSKMPPQPATVAGSSIVHIRATVGKDGVVQSARPISGAVSLIPRSVEAVQKWRYQPSLLDGQPIEWQGDFAIEFRPAS